MQLMNSDFSADDETKEQLVERLKKEAEYLKKKRDAILSDIEKYISENR